MVADVRKKNGGAVLGWGTMGAYFADLQVIHPRALAEMYTEKRHGELLHLWEITNELRPLDLYCYLHAKYGPPNGIQNFLRRDDSDNLIHWEWSLVNDDGLLNIQGHNFRTEVQAFRNLGRDLTREDFIAQLKADFSEHGKGMKAVRLRLEKWRHFVNPYRRIEAVVDRQLQELESLDLDLDRDRKPQPQDTEDMQRFADAWRATSDKYTRALGIAFGVRGMIPVLAESFVNFILFTCAKREIRQNSRLMDEALRRPIDVRVQTLHLYCAGFVAPVDFSHQACKDFHTLMNERNDLLHGNVEVERLAFEDIYFNGKVPIFANYGTFWDRTIGLEARSVRLSDLGRDRAAVSAFRDYILSLMRPEIRDSLALMLRVPHLGFDKKRGILGVLLPTRMVDGRMAPADTHLGK